MFVTHGGYTDQTVSQKAYDHAHMHTHTYDSVCAVFVTSEMESALCFPQWDVFV